MNWNEFFMRHVYLYAAKSKDPSTRVGAVLVRDNVVLCGGYNGFPRRIVDALFRYANHEFKLNLVAHAERNALDNAARNGIKTEGAVLYTNGMPCVGCLKGCIQCGISMIFIHEPWQKIWRQKANQIWKNEELCQQILLQESGITLDAVETPLDLGALISGELFMV